MTEQGVISEWDHGGSGLIESASTPGGCYLSLSALRSPIQWSPTEGDRVGFEYETAEAHGYLFRATKAWPLELGPEAPATSSQ